MSFNEMAFIFIMFVTLAGTLMAVLSGSIIYALAGLVTAMFGIAGLYVYLYAPFFAMMQILIYVGAISILIAFAIMLVGPLYKQPKDWTTVTKFLASLAVSLLSCFVLSKIIIRAFPTGKEGNAFAISTKDIGRALFDKFTLPFELISFLIVVSIIGAIMLVIASRSEK